MGAKALTISSFLFFIVLFIPIFTLNYVWKLKLGKKILISTFRMFLQLFGVGLYLKYLFQLDNNWINLAYILIMISVASYTVIKSVDFLKIRKFILTAIIGIGFPTILVLFLFNRFVVEAENIFSARYLIPIGGMLLGNCLRANIIAISSFSQLLKEKKHEYETLIMLGSSRFESVSAFFFKSIKNASEPTIASIATIGLVSLPGMMTGQILGGSSPMTAIQYQIAIMLAIFCTIVYSIVLNLFFVYRKSFDSMDRLSY